jgi:hypothetical protein
LRKHLKPLVWPVAVLLAGTLTGWLAETAVGRWQDYQLYGLTRPVADLLLVIGALWLVVAVVRLVLGGRGGHSNRERSALDHRPHGHA